MFKKIEVTRRGWAENIGKAGVSKWLKEAGCKPAAKSFEGSNPSPNVLIFFFVCRLMEGHWALNPIIRVRIPSL
jgi:hypothetical protein